MRAFKCKSVKGKLTLGKAVLMETCNVISSGGLIVYPTETIYGLGCDPWNEDAVEKLFAVKRREKDAPISIAVPSIYALTMYAEFDDKAIEFCARHLPGPVTVVLKATDTAPPWLVSKDGLIGLRVPNHPIANELLRFLGPLTSTSANRHGDPPPVTCEESMAKLGDDVGVYVDGGPCKVAKESTVVDLSAGERRIIRMGAIPEEEL